MSEPSFSVIIPAYNRAAHIEHAIASVTGQHYANVEIIVVDDGSTDNTREIVSGIKDPRVYYYWKENQERGAARNYGIERAKGSYITFLDSDDKLMTNFFETASQCIAKDNPDIFHLGYHICDEHERVIKAWKSLPNPVNKKLIRGNYLSCLGVLVKKEILQKYKFNEDRRLAGSEDYELWLRIASRYTINTYPVVSAMLIQHSQRSVINQPPDKLALRIQLLHTSLMQDSAFVSAYKEKLRIFEGTLLVYKALHLAILKKRTWSAKSLVCAFFKCPQLIFSRRAASVVLNILRK